MATELRACHFRSSGSGCVLNHPKTLDQEFPEEITVATALRLFSDEFYDGQLERTLAAAYADAADLGEAFAVARRIHRPTPDRWYNAWSERARAVTSQADDLARSGQRNSARGAYLRASEYHHRQSYFFLRHDLRDPRLLAAYHAHVENFQFAMALLNHPVETAAIPYLNTHLKGYYFAPDTSGEPRPTLVLPCGYDSTAESGWSAVPGAMQRGYNAFIFEGPGQGAALYEQGLFFRREFEYVLTPAIDWLIQRPDVDPDNLILVGRSFAGYLAPRAATAEHRIAALVCDPAQPENRPGRPAAQWVGEPPRRSDCCTADATQPGSGGVLRCPDGRARNQPGD